MRRTGAILLATAALAASLLVVTVILSGGGDSVHGAPGVGVPAATPTPEIDQFPNSLARVEVHSPLGIEALPLTGPTTVRVDLASLVPKAPPEREEIQTEIVSMQLTGSSFSLGSVTLRLRDPGKSPFKHSTGKITENNNIQTNRLDLLGDNAPLCVEHPSPPANCVDTTADSFFDVYFEVEVSVMPGVVMHNETAKRMEETITHKPPARGETYENPLRIDLFYEDGSPAPVWIGVTFHTPDPIVGGMVEPPDLAALPLEAADSGRSNVPYIAGAALAGALLIVAASGWYARRRWFR